MAGSVFRPCHVGTVKIAAIHRIGVKLSERPDSRTLSSASTWFPSLLTLPSSTVVDRSDGGDKLRCLRVNTPRSRPQPRERPHS